MPTAPDIQDPPLKPSEIFTSAERCTRDSEGYSLDEYVLDEKAQLRLEIIWAYSQDIEDQYNNYMAIYMKTELMDLDSLSKQLVLSARDIYGDDYWQNIIEQLKIYLHSPADLNIEKDWNDLPDYEVKNAPFAFQILILLALRNNDEWSSDAMTRIIKRKIERGDRGVHLQLVWHQYASPDECSIQLMNTWESKSGENQYDRIPEHQIVPKVAFAFTQEL